MRVLDGRRRGRHAAVLGWPGVVVVDRSGDRRRRPRRGGRRAAAAPAHRVDHGTAVVHSFRLPTIGAGCSVLEDWAGARCPGDSRCHITASSQALSNRNLRRAALREQERICGNAARWTPSHPAGSYLRRGAAAADDGGVLGCPVRQRKLGRPGVLLEISQRYGGLVPGTHGHLDRAAVALERLGPVRCCFLLRSLPHTACRHCSGRGRHDGSVAVDRLYGCDDALRYGISAGDSRRGAAGVWRTAARGGGRRGRHPGRCVDSAGAA